MMKIKSTGKDIYYICESCGKLITEEERVVLASGLWAEDCQCKFSIKRYNPKTKKFEFIYEYGPYIKTLTPYTKIPKKIYNELLIEDNDVIRLKTFKIYKKIMEVKK